MKMGYLCQECLQLDMLAPSRQENLILRWYLGGFRYPGPQRIHGAEGYGVGIKPLTRMGYSDL